MRTGFGDPLICDIHDTVAILYRRQPVRNDERGASLQQLVQALLEQALRLGVDRGGRFVQDQDPRIGQQGPGERDELPLTLGQLRTAFVHLGLVTLLELADEIVGADRFGRGDDLLFCSVQLAVADIVHDRAGENKAVLQHNPHLAAQRLQRDLRNIVTVDQNLAVGQVVEARDQVDDRGFARARRTDEGDAFPGLHVEVQVFQNVEAWIVGKRHVVELDIALHRRQFLCPRHIADRHRFVQRLEYPFKVSDGVNEVVVQLRQVQDRLPEPGRIAAHCEDHPEGYAFRPHRKQADQIDERRHDRRQIVDGERDQGIVAQRPHPLLAVVACQAGKDAFVVLLAGEDLRHANPADALLQISVHVGAFVRHGLPCPALPGFDQQHDAEEHRQTGQGNQRQPDIHRKHKCGDKDQVDDLQNEVDDPVGQNVRYGVDVVDDPNQDFPLRSVVVIFKRQYLQMLEQIRADIEDDILADPGHDPGSDGRQLDADHDREQHQHGPSDQRAESFLRYRHVDDVLNNERRRQRDRSRQGAQHERDDHRLLLFLDVHHGTPEMLDVKGRFQVLVDVEFIPGHERSPSFRYLRSEA